MKERFREKKSKCLQWKLGLKLREKKIRDFYLLGSYPLVGRHVVNEPKVGCHVVMSSKYRKSDFRWIIHLRLYSGP